MPSSSWRTSLHWPASPPRPDSKMTVGVAGVGRADAQEVHRPAAADVQVGEQVLVRGRRGDGAGGMRRRGVRLGRADDPPGRARAPATMASAMPRSLRRAVPCRRMSESSEPVSALVGRSEPQRPGGAPATSSGLSRDGVSVLALTPPRRGSVSLAVVSPPRAEEAGDAVGDDSASGPLAVLGRRSCRPCGAARGTRPRTRRPPGMTRRPASRSASFSKEIDDPTGGRVRGWTGSSAPDGRWAEVPLPLDGQRQPSPVDPRHVRRRRRHR